MAAQYTKFDTFTSDVLSGKHDFETGVYHVVLTVQEPNFQTDGSIADIVDLADGFGYPAGGKPAIPSVDNVSGISSVESTSVVFTADGGLVGPFRYAVLYNYTHPDNRLVAYWDYGADIILNDTESVTIQFNNGVLTLT